MRSLFRTASLVGLLLALTAPAFAQSPVIPGDRLAWDQTATSVTEAQQFSYLVRVDSATPVVVTAATTGFQCVVITPVPTSGPLYTCSIPFPSATPSVPHTVAVAARRIVTVDGKPVNLDSAFSPGLSFQLEFLPGTPVNLRRVAGSGE